MSAKSDVWTEAFLDDMRQQGDPLADEAIRALFHASKDPQAVAKVIESLVTNDTPTPDTLPVELHDFLSTVQAIAPAHLPHVRLGEQAFAAHGPEVLCLLGCYSLPAAYAARKGVQVLHRTGQLSTRVNHRLMLTAQMVLDVMSPGGMGAGGRGIRTAQKVRLMHAAVRHLLLYNRHSPWDTEDLGVPINQEDLAGTLMTFSYHILHGLDMLGLSLTDEEREAYLDSWQAVGLLMGIRPEMIPDTFADAKILTDTIEGRQIRASSEGKELLQDLLDLQRRLLPRYFRGVPPALMRRLLPREVSDFLGVPDSVPHRWLVSGLVLIARTVDRFTHRSSQRLNVFRFVTLRLIQSMIDHNLGRPARFSIPLELGEAWRVGPATQEPGAPGS
jgi:hypothetical protein